MERPPGLFDGDERLSRLSDICGLIEALLRVVRSAMFRPGRAAALNCSGGVQGRRPPFNPVLVFRILVFQPRNTFSGGRAEFLINDRMPFMGFLGFRLGKGCQSIWSSRAAGQGERG